MTRAAKTPAFPFYGKDAYDDEAFDALPFAAQGFYLRLAWWQWSEGSIPADLELILDKMPRKKIADARKLWPIVSPFFPLTEDGERRQNGTVEFHRRKVCGIREKNAEGASKTNEKRWGKKSGSDSQTESQSDDGTDTNTGTAAATPAPDPPEAPTIVPVPDFVGMEATVHKLRNAPFRYPPPENLCFAWIQTFGVELIVETLVDCEASYTGKHFNYFHDILETRRANPNERPGNRRRRTGNRDASAQRSGPVTLAGTGTDD